MPLYGNLRKAMDSMSISEDSLIPTESHSGSGKKGNVSWHTQSGPSSASESTCRASVPAGQPVVPIGDTARDNEDLVNGWGSEDDYEDDDEESDAGSVFEY